MKDTNLANAHYYPEVEKQNNKYRFLFYKILYPIANRVGLNRQLNLLRHKLGLYSVYGNGRCQWCGETHLQLTKIK